MHWIKNPGVRPIGICEVSRRIISKAVLYVIKGDIQDAAGSNQLCGGQVAGIEAAVHAVRQLKKWKVFCLLMQAMLLTASIELMRSLTFAAFVLLSPQFSLIIYQGCSELFLRKDTLLSQEGTTQGDPLAMPFIIYALREEVSPVLQRAMDLASERGVSSWLTVLPLEEHHFVLHKQAFKDALALRYGWLPSMVPTQCACGQSFTIQHVLSCLKRGYPSIRHNELRLLMETCHSVAIEPPLLPLTIETLTGASSNKQDGARLDIVANGFLVSRYERAFFDVRVFNPYAPSN